MQETRQITYASTKELQKGSTIIFSKAANLADLKSENSDLFAISQGMRAWVKSIEGSDKKGFALDTDGAELPSGNFELLFMNSKNDSGMSKVEQMIEDYIEQFV